MDWLTSHGIKINFKNLKVTLKVQNGQVSCFHSERNGKEYPIISIMKAGKPLRKCCIEYLCYAIVVKGRR